MVGDGESVRFVAHSLKQIEPLGGSRHDHWVLQVRQPDFLKPLRQPAHRNVDHPEFGHRCARRGHLRWTAVNDDYQNVALKMADWSPLKGRVALTVFNEGLGTPDAVAASLKDFDIVCLMRERTAFPRDVIAALPNLKLVVTTRTARTCTIGTTEGGVQGQKGITRHRVRRGPPGA